MFTICKEINGNRVVVFRCETHHSNNKTTLHSNCTNEGCISMEKAYYELLIKYLAEKQENQKLKEDAQKTSGLINDLTQSITNLVTQQKELKAKLNL